MKQRSNMQRLRGSVLTALVFAVIGFAVLLEIRPVVILSGSMEPAISTGSLCLISRVDRRTEPGTIVAYELSNHLVVHRIYGSGPEPGSYLTKGDSNNAADPKPVGEEQIQGTVVGTLPYLGYGVFFLRSRNGMMITVSVAFFLAFVCFRRSYHV